ncbi:dTDP-4-dehydrorhamnose reductase [Eubacterium plexicaudatum ASF492]|uniref:dTDP-4-dehydrorhamnose reductase n=1 Tax=Eubacterium plexicaudatum ASF492 TaxID=1235802 RepID=N2AI11_9FIRM|nr:dTDP-4-dehydrorhamnose reductase [Eubacterium plexicaudatum ASF492]
MKKLLITGCNGQLGRALNRVYEGEQVHIINTDVPELDITDLDAVMHIVREHKPHVIMNCGAMTAVDLCESEYEKAFRINAIGPRNLSIAARETGAKLFQISTDYVFSGNADHPYVETDVVDPQSVYGSTKLAGEQFVRDFADRYFIIRTAWLYGEGKNFAATMLRLAESNDTVRVVSDQFGTPTSALELAKMIHVLEPTENYGIFHGTCEGRCSWADFAAEIFRQAGKRTKVEYITTAEYPTPAKRPAYSVLENRMLHLTTDFRLQQWQDALSVYLKEIL